MPEEEVIEKEEIIQEEVADKKWWDSLNDADLKNNPTLQKYDSAEAAHKGHLKLQESFGMDKVVWPKDENDTERWAEVNKRLGVPEKADGYGLDAVANPEGVQLFDKIQFQDVMMSSGAPKNVAQKVWKSYTEMMKTQYSEAQTAFTGKVAASKAALMQKWGEAYESNVQRGQLVIDTLAENQDQKDFLTVALAQDPRGISFIADIGEKFAESSIGGFQEKRNFTLTPEEAKAELGRIKASPDYRSDDDKVRLPLVDRANELMKMVKNIN